MIQSKSLDRFTAQGCASVIKSIRIFFLAIIAIVCTLSSNAADFSSPAINCQSQRDNVFISTNWDEGDDFILAETPFTVTFYRVQAISTTGVVPYLVDANSGTHHLFRNVECSGNQLILSDPDFGTEGPKTSFEHYYLVIPAGSVAAEDGTVNNDEYQRGFMKMSLTLTPHIIDGKIVDYFSISGEVAEDYAVVHITMYSPSSETIDYFGGHATSFDFQDQGVYNIFAMVNISFRGEDGTYYNGATTAYSAIELNGIFTDCQLSAETNELNHVTKLIAAFPQNDAMAVNHKRSAEYPYIENEVGERTYFDYHNFAGNELHLPLNSPLTESGNYRLVIPEEYVNYLYNNGVIVIPNKHEITCNFTVGAPAEDAGINSLPDPLSSNLYDVYTMQGVKIASKVDRTTLTDKLTPGIYLLSNGTETVKAQIR